MKKENRKRKKRFPVEYVVLGLLFLIAVALSIGVVKKLHGRSDTAAALLPSSVPTSVMVVSPTKMQTEQDILTTPGKNATPEERSKYAQLVTKFAKTADVLDITSCKPKPLVYKIVLGDSIIVKNDDSIPHSFVVNQDNRFDIPANGTQSISINFTQGPGIYGFGCDGSSTAVGMFLVTK